MSFASRALHQLPKRVAPLSMQRAVITARSWRASGGSATPSFARRSISRKAYPDSGVCAYPSSHETLSPLMPAQTLLDAKVASGKTFEQIGKDIGRTEVYVAALCYGQAKPATEDIEGLSKSLGVSTEETGATLGEGFYPQRGLGPMPPTDPLIYRLYEIVLVYGHPLKAVINEKFGDGIMSAINFECHVEKIEKDGAERVKITLDGKWLPHTRF